MKTNKKKSKAQWRAQFQTIYAKLSNLMEDIGHTSEVQQAASLIHRLEDRLLDKGE